MRIECGDCDWEGTDADTDLSDVEDLLQRIDPGSEVPAGPCPKCGSLCYVLEKDNVYAFEVRKLRKDLSAIQQAARHYLKLHTARNRDRLITLADPKAA